MSLDAMKQALEALEFWEENLGRYKNHEWPISMRDGVITIRLIPPVRKVGGGRRLAIQAVERVELSHKHKTAKEMLCAAIEQAQDPVAWMNPSWIDPDTRGWASDSFESIQIEGWIPLYTAPRQWQGLTADEIWQCNAAPPGSAVEYHICMAHQNVLDFAEAIETKLKEKNG